MRGKLPATGSYVTRLTANIIGATIHYTAGPSNLNATSIANFQLGRVADPKTGAKFPAIAYTYIIEQDGTVVQCHDLNIRCWHSGAVVNGVSRNDNYIGVCWSGDDVPNTAQLLGIKTALRHIEQQLGRPLQKIEGHREAPYATQCPGNRWKEWIDLVRVY